MEQATSQQPSARFQALTAEAKSRIQEASPREVADLVDEGAILIDVREREEFAHQHIPGAVHLSCAVLEQQIEKMAPDLNTPMVCYCNGGNRSALAVDNLQKMGYTNVVSLAGGILAWTETALPTTSDVHDQEQGAVESDPSR
jgi:phage shock protein E